MDVDISERYTEGDYASQNADWHDGDAHWKAGSILEFLRSHGPTPESICDVGCGTAGVLAALQAELPTTKMVGYEISPQAVTLARTQHPEIEVREAPSEAIDDHFGLLMALDVFEHVGDYLGFLRGLHGRADRYLFRIPLDMNTQMVLRGGPVMDRRKRLGHLHYFSRDTAIATLEDSGYKVVAESYTPVIARSRLARAAVRPRRAAMRIAPHFAVRALGGFSLLVLAETAGDD